MISDYAFFKGIDDAVHLLSKFSDKPTYYYLFGHRAQISTTTLLGLPSDLNLGKKKILSICSTHFQKCKTDTQISSRFTQILRCQSYGRALPYVY